MNQKTVNAANNAIAELILVYTSKLVVEYFAIYRIVYSISSCSYVGKVVSFREIPSIDLLSLIKWVRESSNFHH